jgi:sugar lactone lactonase YvrE
MMQTVKELQRHASPAGRPQPMAFHGETLWVGCWDTSRLYAIDTKTWSILDDVAVPGRPYGLASYGGAIRVVISSGEDDDRYFCQFIPGRGFDPESTTACPELTGSHLASDGRALYLTQMAYERILEFDADGSVAREIALPSRCAGIGFGAGAFYMISADEEFEDLRLATLDIQAGHPDLVPVAAMSAEARGLAFDGTAWWTCHREASEIASFTLT